MSDIQRKYEIEPVINLSGPLTIYGSSISSSAVAEASAEALRHHWNMDELYQRSGELIAAWSGTEAGFLTSSSASGLTLAVAACMTGADMGKIGQLPDTDGMRNEVVIQKGHAVNFGAPIEQMIRLAGAVTREVGTVNRTTPDQIKHAIGPQTAAGMFVISHHTTLYGYVQLQQFVEMFHEHGIPVIIDGAAQDHQIDRMVASGADLIVLSSQKYLSGPTASVICGRKDLVKAIYLQNRGIGRTMKVGKEGIVGTMAALSERMATDLSEWEAEQRAKAEFLTGLLQDLPGIHSFVEKDLVGQPVHRVKLIVDADTCGFDAEQICQLLQASSPSIKPRAHHTDEGWFYLEPVHVSEDEMRLVADRLSEIVGMPDAEKDAKRAAVTSRGSAARSITDRFVAWLS